jgi:hypothetical protein
MTPRTSVLAALLLLSASAVHAESGLAREHRDAKAALELQGRIASAKFDPAEAEDWVKYSFIEDKQVKYLWMNKKFASGYADPLFDIQVDPAGKAAPKTTRTPYHLEITNKGNVISKPGQKFVAFERGTFKMPAAPVVGTPGALAASLTPPPPAQADSIEPTIELMRALSTDEQTKLCRKSLHEETVRSVTTAAKVPTALVSLKGITAERDNFDAAAAQPRTPFQQYCDTLLGLSEPKSAPDSAAAATDPAADARNASAQLTGTSQNKRVGGDVPAIIQSDDKGNGKSDKKGGKGLFSENTLKGAMVGYGLGIVLGSGLGGIAIGALAGAALFYGVAKFLGRKKKDD